MRSLDICSYPHFAHADCVAGWLTYSNEGTRKCPTGCGRASNADRERVADARSDLVPGPSGMQASQSPDNVEEHDMQGQEETGHARQDIRKIWPFFRIDHNPTDMPVVFVEWHTTSEDWDTL